MQKSWVFFDFVGLAVGLVMALLIIFLPNFKNTDEWRNLERIGKQQRLEKAIQQEREELGLVYFPPVAVTPAPVAPSKAKPKKSPAAKPSPK